MEPVVLPYSTPCVITLGAKYNENSTIVKNDENVLITKLGNQIRLGVRCLLSLLQRVLCFSSSYLFSYKNRFRSVFLRKLGKTVS